LVEKKNWAKIAPHLLVTPVLAENVTELGVADIVQMIHGNDLLDAMAFVDIGMRDGGIVNHGLVVTKDILPLSDCNAKIM
jgi:hypothetical protein